LRGASADDQWWRRLLDAVGHSYVAPEFFRIPALREWLADHEAQASFRILARDALEVSSSPTQPAHDRLRRSYADHTGEHELRADGPIEVVVGVLVAGVLSELDRSDTVVVALLQAAAQSINDRFDALGDQRDRAELGLLVSVIASDALRPILQRRVLVPQRSGAEIRELVHRLTDGDLRFAEASTHADVLGWAARLHATDTSTIADAKSFRARAVALDPALDSRVTDAWITATDGDAPAALRMARDIDGPDGRATILGLLHRTRDVEVVTEWFDEQPERNQPEFLTGVGWYNAAVVLVTAGRWEEAIDRLRVARALTAECPGLVFLEGLLNAAMLLAAPFRLEALQSGPYLTTLPVLEGPASDRHREDALVALETAARLLDTLNMPDHAEHARLTCLWLRVTHPSRHVSDRARREVVDGMRTGARAVQLLPLAHAIGLPVDPAPVRRFLETRRRLGGLSAQETVADFISATVTLEPRDRADYIEREEARLSEAFSPLYLTGQRIQALLDDGQVTRASALLEERKDNFPQEVYRRLRNAIDIRSGHDVRAEAERLYRESCSLVDLRALIAILRRAGDWAGLLPLHAALFREERTTENAEGLVDCMHRMPTPQDDAILRFLRENSDLTACSSNLASAEAWALFRIGSWRDADQRNRALLAQRHARQDLSLDVNIALQAGDWERFPAIVEREWPERGTHDAHTLLRLASLAGESDATSERAWELATLAAEKASDRPEVLIGAISLGFQLGRDTDVRPAWLSRAVELSSDTGPVHRVELRRVVEDLIPAARHRSQAIEEQLTRGELPLHLAATALSVPLSQVLIRLARQNAAQNDGRRRAVIPIRAGSREPVKVRPEWSLGMDITTVFVLGHVELLGRAFQTVNRVVLAPDTMSFLLTERRRVRFHQPSRVEDAQELRSLIDSGRLTSLPSVQPPERLTEEVGRDLADLLHAAKLRNATVVHPLPIHRLRSFQEEEAELRDYAECIVSTMTFIDALHGAGLLDNDTHERTRDYLRARGHGRETSPIRDIAGHTFYLDDLTLTYLQGARVLDEIGRSGLLLGVHPSVRGEQDALIEASRDADRLARAIDAVRRELRDALASGRAVFLPRRESSDDVVPFMDDAPTLAAFVTDVAMCDAVCVDDRFLNRHATVTDRAGRTVPILSVLDLLYFMTEQGTISHDERRTVSHRLRQASFGVLPLDPDDLEHWLRSSVVAADNAISEGAELRAIRQYLMRLRSIDMVQQPAETAFLDRLRVVAVAVMRRLWRDTSIPVEHARAASDWIWQHVAPSPIDWARTSRDRAGLLPLHEATGVHVTSALQLLPGLPEERETALSEWITRTVLEPLMPANAQALDRTADNVKGEIERWLNVLPVDTAEDTTR
jgi:hypothetical protein